MRQPRLFAGKDVMSKVAKALPKRGRATAAIAYVTYDHLRLRKGDAIAVNASEAAVRSGATNPRVLMDLYDRDVAVVNQPMLHAKAIVRGATVAIGSANLSHRTLELDELMWVTDDELLLRRTSHWLDGLLKPDPMSRDEMEALLPLYGTDRVGVAGGPAGAGHEAAGPPRTPEDAFAAGTVSRLWLWRSEPLQDDLRTSDTTAGTHFGTLTGKDWIRNASAASTRDNDVWIRFGRGRLHPPARVFKARSSDVAPDGSRWTLVGFDADARSVTTPDWVKQKYGATVSDVGEVLVETKDIDALLALWRS